MAISKTFASLALAHPSRRWIAKIYALLVMRVAIVALVDGVLCALCDDGTVLEMPAVQPPNKQPMAARATDKDMKRFVGEVAVLSTLRHPNVVQFLGAVWQPGLMLVLEWMEGGSVHAALAATIGACAAAHVAAPTRAGGGRRRGAGSY